MHEKFSYDVHNEDGCVLHEDPQDESMQHGSIFINELCIIALESNFSCYVHSCHFKVASDECLMVYIKKTKYTV